MAYDIVFSGFGGQGALFAGQLLAYAAMDAGHKRGRHVVEAIDPAARFQSATELLHELDIVTAIIERSAIAMESARLLSESQKLAAKERTIGEIAAKISSKSEIEDLLKTAAQELGRSLPGMEVAIQLTKEEIE